jgi:cytochrome oxidase Cu insertion factor (SCO1/SenC/PrrC family)
MNLNNRPVWLLPALSAAAALILAALLVAFQLTARPDSSAGAAPMRVSGQAQIGGPFTLINQDGETVTDADFRGKAMLIYFGFTYCPDICPTSLQVMKVALDQLAPSDREAFQPLLISVDPERDTPELLNQYVDSPAFPAGLMGLTGSEDQVRAAARAYRVFYSRVDDDGVSTEYTVDHSSLIYLMGPDGSFVDVFPHATTPDQMAARLQRFLEDNPVQS